MKKIIIILSILFCVSAIYSQTFKEFFANNSVNGNLDSKYYSINYDGLRVYLSGQNLTDLEGLDIISIQNRSIADFNHLALSLNNNQLTSLPKSIIKLTNLQTLNLNNNQLNFVPESIGKLTNLQTLYLGNNQLKIIPESIGKLNNLQTLYLKNNQLKFVPESIENLKQLAHLNISKNKLAALPDIGPLGNLTLLNLYNNMLTSLPDSIGSLTRLKELYLNSNELTSLPNSMNKLTKLKKLNLNNNPLTRMPLNLLKKPNLKYLLNYTPLGAALYYSKLKNAGIFDSRLQPILISSFYHNYYENEKPNLSDFKFSFALESIKDISSLLTAKTPKVGCYNPMSRMTLPRTTIKEQFNKQRTKKRKIEETEAVEYQLPQEIIRNIYTYLD